MRPRVIAGADEPAVPNRLLSSKSSLSKGLNPAQRFLICIKCAPGSTGRSTKTEEDPELGKQEHVFWGTHAGAKVQDLRSS
jgi:hypothetical protein